MVSKKVTLTNKTGLHARPASNLVAFVKKFQSTVTIINGEKKANAASIINVLTLGAKQGTELEIVADGADEAIAVEEIAKYIADLKEW